MNRQRKLILVAAAIGIISVFLPWFSAGAFGFSVHVNGFHGWGILVFICFAVSAVISLVGNQEAALDKSAWFAALLCGGLALLSIVINMISSQTGSAFGIVSAQFGFGIWIALAAAVGVTLFAWLYKNPADDLKSGFESLKKTVASATPSSGDTGTVSNDTIKITEIERLSKLKESGSITEEEFQQLKSKIL